MQLNKHIACSLLATIISAFAMSAQAAVITRAEFGSDAVNYGFENSAEGVLKPTDGFLTVSGAYVTGGYNVPGQNGFTYTNAGSYGTAAGAAMRFSFASAVSAVGFNAYYNNAPVLFQVFNAQGTLLDSISTMPTDCGSICGFIGLKANGISYAIASLPSVNAHNLFADNVVYETQDVPEPASIALFGLGALALGLRRRKH